MIAFEYEVVMMQRKKVRFDHKPTVEEMREWEKRQAPLVVQHMLYQQPVDTDLSPGEVIQLDEYKCCP